MELERQDFDPGGSFSEVLLNNPRHLLHSFKDNKAVRRKPDCDFYKCFDIIRCSQHTKNIKVHIYPASPLADGVFALPHSKQFLDILDAIYTSAFYTPDPEEACLLVPSVDTLNLKHKREEIESALSGLEYWNQGRNHLIFNFIGDTAKTSVNQAMIASSTLNSYSYRPSFDISLPFFVPETFTSPSGNSDQLIGQTDQLIDSKSPLVSAIDRPWSLLVFENRLDMKLLQEFSNISHPAAIIVKPCQNQILHQNLHFCHLGKDYSASQLVSESRFCFVSGVPSTLNFLLAQVLQQGCVPVILQEAAVLPFSEIIDWSLISVRIRRNEVGNIFNILKYVEPNYPSMQAKLAEVYAEYMSSPASIALTALRIINSRTNGNHGLSHEDWNLSKAKQSPLFLQRYPRPNAGFTAVILTYDRLETLFKIITQISEVESLQRILVVWNHQTNPPPQAQHWPKINKPLKVVQTKSNRLSNRFYPYAEIETECVFSLDDDITMLTTHEIEFGYQTWREFPDRIVGFPSRLHQWNSSSKSWNYESEWRNQHSIILTGAAFYNNYWNYVYTGAPGPKQTEIRDWVDDNMNCEDISFNFMVSNLTSKPNIKVGPRKKYRCVTASCENGNMLSKDSAHLARRTKCIEKLSEAYGGMPLTAVEFRADPLLYKENVPGVLNSYSNLGAL